MVHVTAILTVPSILLVSSLSIPSGVYPCCGRPAQRGPSHRPLPQSGCAHQSHTPLTPPEAPIYHLNSDSAISDPALAHETQAVGLVHTLLKHQSLIVRTPGDIKQDQAQVGVGGIEDREAQGHQHSSTHEVRN